MTNLLLFINLSEFLGEVRIHDGALAQVMLTGTGEERIGASVKDWQTRGVPVRREIFGTHQRPHDIVFFQERIQPRDKGFAEALSLWCEEHRITVIRVLSHLHADCWSTMQRLPLEPQERFAMVSALAHANPDELITWHAFLKEADQTAHLERQAADAAITKLYQKTAEGLVKRFSHPTRSAHA